MGIWIPALLLGGVGASHHYASRELDYITKEVEQPTFGFWWGISLGLFGGLWTGITFRSAFIRAFKWLEWIVTFGEFGGNRRNVQNDEKQPRPS